MLKKNLMTLVVAVALVAPSISTTVEVKKGRGPSSDALICKFIPQVCNVHEPV